ncbi:hypothetical protein [Actinoallomurus iriomotensis]|uniref:Uncharacterized protein n=1 Tax=Actinoallomurus iriomotensis TaxID=478107 RepID=A0A9W6S5J2_9ACTN|nr:hypothetical protein [Actinoallomurus iriomotensis]GLY87769.1 hypothetical protein Airi02_056980 [Actinoallomurus iriomotensis]
MHTDEHLAQIEDAPRPIHREPRRTHRRMAETAGRDLDAINAARSMRGLPALIPNVPDAEQAAARLARKPAEKPVEKPKPPAQEWPADLPRPNEGFRYPSIGALAAWLGVEYRRFDPYEIAKMVSAWAKVASAHGLLADEDLAEDVATSAPPRPKMRRERIPNRPVPRPGRVANLGNRRAA